MTVCVGGFDIQDLCWDRPEVFRGDASDRAAGLWKVSPKNSAFCHFFLNKVPAVRSLFFSRCGVEFEGTEAQGMRPMCVFFFFTFPQQKFSYYFPLYFFWCFADRASQHNLSN